MTTLYREVTVLDNGQVWKVKKARKQIHFPVYLMLFLAFIAFATACSMKLFSVTLSNELNSFTTEVKITRVTKVHSKAKIHKIHRRDNFKSLDIPLDEELQRYAWEQCKKNGIDYAVFIAQMGRESSYNPNAMSNTDDYGLMQINACNMSYLCTKLNVSEQDIKFDPKTNIDAAVALWKDFIEDYPPTDNAGLLMRYNMGPSRAAELMSEGIISKYASNILADAEIISAQLEEA